MLKIKKGIKKKIKGKKDKNDEIFTPEELERYKKEKEEEARRLAEQQQQQQQQEAANEEKENVPEEGTTVSEEEGATAVSTSEAQESSGGGKGEDWRNFFAATDTVLKKTTDNLVHIKEASYFQKKDEKIVEVCVKETEVQESASSTSASAAAGGKKWVDLERGGIDDESEEVEEEVKEAERPEPEEEPEPELAPLQFIEDLPDVDVDDFTEVFDTTYVDNVESGEVKLHYIPDSPTLEDPNEPDPFDTSVVDKVLHTEEPKSIKTPEPKQQPEKKKKKLVSLGCAVDVLTGKVQTAEKPSGTPPPDSKRRRIVKKDINLFGEDNDSTDDVTAKEEGETENQEEKPEADEPEDKNILDDILCVDDALDIPETGTLLCPTPRAVSPALSEGSKENKSTEDTFEHDIVCENKEVDLSEFLESNGEDHESKENKQDSGKDLDLKDLVAEFDIIDKSEVTNETLIPAEPEDEFDAEFAFLAAESVAKAKEKELEDLEDDPFDTSVAAQVLGPEDTAEAEKDPFDVGFADEVLGEDTSAVKAAKPPPPRPALPKAQKETEEADPFDTSAAEKVLPVDHLASPDTAFDLPETLQPHSGTDIVKSESFDPFDTSIAETFGKTELKVLETELLTANQLESKKQLENEDDFDFDPRAGEPVKATPPRPPQPCLLTADEEEVTSGPVLTPAQGTEEDFDPFDTSIATKVVIKSLEEELLSDTSKPLSENKSQPPPRPPPVAVQVFATTPTDTNPTLQPSDTATTVTEKSVSEIDDSFDPFDTSIAENFGKTELKALEDELLTGEPVTEAGGKVEQEKPDPKNLNLPVKPLRPPSPKCLLAATPLDENPTLQPTLEPTEGIPCDQPEDFDPFDTSIADQFGKTELKVLESELLVTASIHSVDDIDNFDPRGESEVLKKKPSRPPSPAHPQCLLTATPAGTPPGTNDLLVPSDPKTATSSEEFDPFDTSIAEKFGKTELKHLESELLQAHAVTADPFDDFNPRGKETEKSTLPQKLERPAKPPLPPAPCLLATTPTDQSAPLQPTLNPVQEPKEGVTPEDFDPFDTSIAAKLCKTEIKALEESFLDSHNIYSNTQSKSEIPVASTKVSSVQSNSDKHNYIADHFLSSSPTEGLGPSLQPVQSSLKDQPAEFDPFDTSIAEHFGKTELKTLESELLCDSGVKRNLSDDEFDPREEETKAPKRPSPPIQKPPTPVNLLDASEEHNITVQPIQASQAVSNVDTLDDYDPFDTTIAENIGPSKAELKYLESELLSAAEDPFDTSNIA